MSLNLSFDNTANAFEYKSDQQLRKAHFLFSSMGIGWLVKLGTRVTPWAIKAGLPIQGIIRKTIFEQFVGGETLEQTARVADKLEEFHVQVILDYGVEGGDYGEAEKDHARDEFIRVIDYAATQQNIPFMSIKVTGLARFALLEKMDDAMTHAQGTLIKRYEKVVSELNEEEKAEWQLVWDRMMLICKTAADKNVGVLIDAEETWIQDPVDALTTLMMDHFNKTKAVVYNTAQLYRHDRLQFVKDCFEAAEQRHFILGIKLVRGAYMEKERERAQLNNYPSPIQDIKENSDRDYDLALEECLRNIDMMGLCAGTHNEKSSQYLVELMSKNNVNASDKRVYFSQLLGMSDHISYNLALAGYNVSKYVPYGPVKEVLPYLIRRAQENTSVKGQTGRELSLIIKEKQRRRSK